MTYEIRDIVKILKNKREEKELSLRDLSDRTNISPSTLQRYETMETTIPLDKFQKICDALGLKADELLGNKKSSEEVKTAARNKKVFDRYEKLDANKKKIIDDLINSYFDDNVDDEEDENEN